MLRDEEIKADIMNRLLRKHCWGARYFPLDTLVRWISKKIEENGRRVQRLIRQLVNDGYLMLHKGGMTVSLNPARSKEILEFIRRFII
jgi:hypothetical protein